MRPQCERSARTGARIIGAEKMLDMVKQDQLTTVSGVPTMWNAMLHAQGDYTPEDDGIHLEGDPPANARRDRLDTGTLPGPTET